MSNFKRIGKSSIAILILFSIFLQSACYNREAAVKMSQTGINLSDNLGKFYDDLAMDARDAWRYDIYDLEIKRLNIIKRKLTAGEPITPSQPISEKDENQIFFYQTINCNVLYEELNSKPNPPNSEIKTSGLVMEAQNNAINRCIVDALKDRAKLARNLSVLFAKLKELADYKYSDEVQTAVTSLSQSAASLIPLPFVKAVIPSELLGEISKDIADLVQEKKVEKRAEDAKLLIDRFQKLFIKELPVYKLIIKNLHGATERIAKFAVEDGRVEIWQLLKNAPVRLGLIPIESKWKEAIQAEEKVSTTDTPQQIIDKELKNATRKAQIEAFVKIIQFQSDEVSGNMQSAATDMNTALLKMSSTITDYINDSKKIDVTAVNNALGRVSAYLEAAKEARENYLKEKKEKEEKKDGN